MAPFEGGPIEGEEGDNPVKPPSLPPELPPNASVELPPLPTGVAVESGEVSPESRAEDALVESRWRTAMKDPDVRRGVISAVRTLINIGVAAADTIPVLGEVASWSADSIKMWGPWIKRLGGPNLDLTPSVSKKLAWGTEPLDVMTGGAIPSHSIEAYLQFKREDLGRLKRGYKSLRRILAREKVDYVAHQAEIDKAIKTFTKQE